MEFKNNLTSVTFFYPSKIMGGAEFLFMRLSSVLVDIYNLDVCYVDYEDGFVRNYKGKNAKIRFLDFKDNLQNVLIPENTVIVAPLSSILEVATYLKVNNAKLFFWSIHPVGLEEYFTKLCKKLHIPFTSHRKMSLGKVIDVLIAKNGLYFMDKPNFDYQKSIFNFQHSDFRYLPIPVSEKGKVSLDSSHSEINIAWLGRISSDKVFSLKNVVHCCLEHLSKNFNDKIRFHVIGDGPQRHMLTDYDYDDRFEIVYQIDLKDTSLQVYLRENVQVLFAMGTSALEGASLGIATILVDYSYIPFRTQYFRWLYEAEGFSLGDPFSEDRQYCTSFEDIIEFIKEKLIGDYANNCYRYFLENHSSEIINKKFFTALNSTQLTQEALKKTNLKAYFWISKLRKLIHHLKLICKKS